jgi:hypothetical protein
MRLPTLILAVGHRENSQIGFFDADKRLAAISAKGDPKAMIDRLMARSPSRRRSPSRPDSPSWLKR